MAWPIGSDISTTNLDQGTDDPNLARADLKTLTDQHNAMKNARGAADGVASLGAGGKVPVGELPTNVANGIMGLDASAKALPANLPRGTANGVASLDASTKILPAELPAASETAVGAVEIATQAETNAGTDDARAVTPAKLNNWTGDSSLITVGNLTTGTWNADTLQENRGGTGETSYTNGQILIGNSAGNGLNKATITPGNGIDITNGAGSITITAEVSSTTNQGVVELATNAEANAGTDATRAVTPANLGQWPGDTSITTLGTVTTGTWNANTIGTNKGGTGVVTTPANGQLLIGNGTGYVVTNLTEGNGIDITNGAGSVTITAETTSETNPGVIELATQAEADAGTDDVRAVTPKKINDWKGHGLDRIALGSGFNVASIDIINLAGAYRRFLLIWTAARPVTDNANLLMRLDSNNGASFDAGASDYAYAQHRHDSGGVRAASGSAATTNIVLTIGQGNQSHEYGSGEAWIDYPHDTARFTQVLYKGSYRNQSGTYLAYSGIGVRLNAQADNAIQLLYSSGNISAIEWYLYGLRW